MLGRERRSRIRGLLEHDAGKRNSKFRALQGNRVNPHALVHRWPQSQARASAWLDACQDLRPDMPAPRGAPRAEKPPKRLHPIALPGAFRVQVSRDAGCADRRRVCPIRPCPIRPCPSRLAHRVAGASGYSHSGRAGVTVNGTGPGTSFRPNVMRRSRLQLPARALYRVPSMRSTESSGAPSVLVAVSTTL